MRRKKLRLQFLFVVFLAVVFPCTVVSSAIPSPTHPYHYQRAQYQSALPGVDGVNVQSFQESYPPDTEFIYVNVQNQTPNTFAFIRVGHILEKREWYGWKLAIYPSSGNYNSSMIIGVAANSNPKKIPYRLVPLLLKGKSLKKGVYRLRFCYQDAWYTPTGELMYLTDAQEYRALVTFRVEE